MSEVEITSAGRVAVSVPLLREQAVALAGIRDRLLNTVASLTAAGQALIRVTTTSAFAVSNRAETLHDRADVLRSALDHAANTYEYAEWLATAEAHRGVDAALAHAYEQKIADATAADPTGMERAKALVNGTGQDPLAHAGRTLAAGTTTPLGLLDAFGPRPDRPGSWWPTKRVAPPVGAAPFTPYGLRLPSLTSPATMTGRAAPGAHSPIDAAAAVVARRVREAPMTPAPLTITGMLDHLPNDADITITTYEFDGHREHVVAIDGTENWLPMGSDDVLDLDSNLELFLAQESSLREAIGHAMADAGVLATEPVTVVGYSQGAMGALAEASDQRFAIGEVVTIGAPQDHWLPEHVRHVDLSHLNDPVAALAAGAWATSGLGQRDISVRTEGGHGRAQYRETARKADASDDPRIRALHDDWQRFESAKAAVRREYELERTAAK